MEAALTVRMSVRPPAKFTEKTDWSLWISRFERYVKEAKVPDSERVKELLPLLEDEPLRLVVQYGLSESADYAAVHECLQCRYGHDGTELEWQVKFQARVQQRDESLVEYIGELRMLASRAFPGWSEEQRDVLIRNQFIQGVSSSSIQVQLLKEMPKSVKDAATLARRLETVEMAHRRLQTERIAERPLAVAAPVSATSLEDKLDKLSAQVKKLADEVTILREPPERADSRVSGVRNTPREKAREVVCWHCREQGHVKRNCLLLSKPSLNGNGSAERVNRRPRMY